ncbi:MAG: FAD-dependent monooxygenase, partial [Pseudomonadota bacterium]
VTYLLRDRTLANIVAVQERPAWQEESWTIPGDVAALRAAFRDWHPDVTGLLARVEQCYLWGLFTRPPLPRWSDGPVVLIGDACHPTLPFMAQGAAMGIEDAGRLAAMVRASNDLAATLIQFKLQREPRTTRLQQQARRNAGLFHLTDGPFGLIARAKLNAASLLPGSLSLAPLDWIYGYRAVWAASPRSQ